MTNLTTKQKKVGERMKNEVKVPILNDEYSVIVCWGSPEKIAKTLKRWYYPKDAYDTSFTNDSMQNRRGVTYYHSKCHPVIALPSKPKTNAEIGTLAHEAVHAIEDIFEKIQQPIGGELFAHSIGAVVRGVLK